jgi:hypothetical protein
VLVHCVDVFSQRFCFVRFVIPVDANGVRLPVTFFKRFLEFRLKLLFFDFNANMFLFLGAQKHVESKGVRDKSGLEIVHSFEFSLGRNYRKKSTFPAIGTSRSAGIRVFSVA